MKEFVFLVIVLIMASVVFYLNRKRNAWDVMFFNTTFAIVVLFMIGLLKSDVWDKVVYTLGLVAIGSGIAGIFKVRNNK